MDQQAEIIERMNRWAAYRWQPPAQAPRRDPRLVGLLDPLRTILSAATEADWELVAAALATDPGWLAAYDEAIQLGMTAGRANDVYAASQVNPGVAYYDYGERLLRDETRFAGYAAQVVVVLADVLPTDLVERVLGPWTAAFGPPTTLPG